jgi:hypothetical protein
MVVAAGLADGAGVPADFAAAGDVTDGDPVAAAGDVAPRA